MVKDTANRGNTQFVMATVDDLRDAIRDIVAEVRTADSSMPADRLGFTEPEAARLLGLNPWQLGDARRAGKISATKIGKKYIYARETLVSYIAARD